MSGVPLERDQRYRVALEALVTANGATFTQYRADTGLRSQGAEPAGPSFLVVFGDCCSVQLALGENGLTLQKVRLASADRAVITAMVSAGADAPDWLPPESSSLLFDGDRIGAAEVAGRYVPFAGLLNEPETMGSQTTQSTTLEQLAIAAGRSVARANAALAQTVSPAGVALVSGLTIQVAVSQAEVRQGRLVIAAALPGGQSQGPTQYVQLTLTTVPGAETATGTAAPVAGAPAAGVTESVSQAAPGPGAPGTMAGGTSGNTAPPVSAVVRHFAGKSRPVRASEWSGRSGGKK